MARFVEALEKGSHHVTNISSQFVESSNGKTFDLISPNNFEVVAKGRIANLLDC